MAGCGSLLVFFALTEGTMTKVDGGGGHLRRLLAALVTGGTLLVVAVALLVASATKATGPETAGWLEAIATCAAVAAAIAAAAFAAGAYRLEEQREVSRLQQESRARRVEREDQARLVACWTGKDLLRAALGSGARSIALKGSLTDCIFARNASALPVYDVTFEIFLVRDNHNGTFSTERVGVEVRGLLAPHPEAHRQRLDAQTVDTAQDIIDRMGDDFAVRAAMSFTDASGVRWHRSIGGVLSDGGDR